MLLFGSGGKIVHASIRSVILCSALGLPLILSGQENRDQQNRAQTSQTRQFEDSAHKVHEWNANEDAAYRRYLEEHHKKYHDFAQARKTEQNDYLEVARRSS